MLPPSPRQPRRLCVLVAASSVALLTLPGVALAQASEAADAEAEGDEPADGGDEEVSEDLRSQVGVGTQKDEARVETDRDRATPAPSEDSGDESEDPTYGHQGQFGLRAGLALGYKILIRFDDSPPCDINGDGDDEEVCAYNTPPSLDLAASFAFFDSIEPYVWLRLGLSEHTETSTEATRLIGAGLRVYTMSDAQLKLFFEPALAIEFEGATASAPPNTNYGTDYVVHGHFGLQYDFLEHLGLYASVGPNVSFARAIGTEFEGSIGLQGRAP